MSKKSTKAGPKKKMSKGIMSWKLASFFNETSIVRKPKSLDDKVFYSKESKALTAIKYSMNDDFGSNQLKRIVNKKPVHFLSSSSTLVWIIIPQVPTK